MSTTGRPGREETTVQQHGYQVMIMMACYLCEFKGLSRVGLINYLHSPPHDSLLQPKVIIICNVL